ncbi:hypothetical protein ACYSNX_10740 [Myroides sp. LJL115]
MKELDLLKKHWNQQKDFPKVSQEQISKMIHKKSSSIVKWILIISVLEFIVLNVLSQISWRQEDFNQIDNKVIFWILSNIDLLSGVVSIVFIGFFYKNFKAISTACSTRILMEQILRTKRTVNYYIYFNIVFTCCFFLIIMQQVLASKNYSSEKYLFGLGVTLVTLGVFIGFIWVYYRIIYGLLIKRLMKNYRELQKIEQ